MMGLARRPRATGSAQGRDNGSRERLCLRHSGDILNLKVLSDVARLLFWEANGETAPRRAL